MRSSSGRPREACEVSLARTRGGSLDFCGRTRGAWLVGVLLAKVRGLSAVSSSLMRCSTFWITFRFCTGASSVTMSSFSKSSSAYASSGFFCELVVGGSGASRDFSRLGFFF